MSLRGHHKVTTAVVQTASLLVVRFGKQWCAVPSQGVRGVLVTEAGHLQRIGHTATGFLGERLDRGRRVIVRHNDCVLGFQARGDPVLQRPLLLG